MKAMSRRTHSGRTSVSGLRSRRLYSFCTLTNRGAPGFSASWASLSWAAEKLEHPISRTLPSPTKSARASRVSPIGVAGSGRCSWYKST